MGASWGFIWAGIYVQTSAMALTELTINALGPKGDGIHQNSRGRVFVERTVPGDRVKARLERDSMGLSRGEVIEVMQPSRFRMKAPCPHYEACGNCTLQHINEGFYRNWKKELVGESFAKVGLLPRRWIPPVFLPGANRRRATFSARRTGKKIHFGYYRRRSKLLTDIDTCLIADPRILEFKKAFAPHLPSLLKAEETLDVFVQLVGDQVDVVLTGNAVSPKVLSEIGITRLSVRATEKDEPRILFQKTPITTKFGSLKVELPPGAFLQPTLAGEKALTDAVLAALPAKGRFADLFSGSGTFTGPLSARGPVEAFESTPSAVRALSKAGIRAFRRDLFRQPLRREELRRYDAVVFDPPRAGCEAQAEALAQSGVPVVVGVSCNPATLARDARILADGGYWLQSLQLVDQFLFSHHVEVVAVFTKKRRR